MTTPRIRYLVQLLFDNAVIDRTNDDLARHFREGNSSCCLCCEKDDCKIGCKNIKRADEKYFHRVCAENILSRNNEGCAYLVIEGNIEGIMHKFLSRHDEKWGLQVSGKFEVVGLYKQVPKDFLLDYEYWQKEVGKGFRFYMEYQDGKNSNTQRINFL